MATTTTLKVQIASNLAEVLAPFDGAVQLQSWDVRDILLRDTMRRLADELLDIVENRPEPAAEDVLGIARRLEQVAAGIAAVA